MNNIYDKLVNSGIPCEQVLRDEPMAKHITFRVGGAADLFITVNNVAELRTVLGILTEENAEHFLIGNGSNLLFTDEGYRGAVVKLDGEFGAIRAEGNKIYAGASSLLSRVAQVALENSLAGMEPVSGIPGSIGGAIFMNAGAYGGEMKDIVESVKLVSCDGSEEFELSNSELDFGYRHSGIQESGAIVTEVVIALPSGDKEEIRANMLDFMERRNSKQPVNFPSAGSTFKRPVGGYAAALIDQAGLKGTSVGGAEVSEKHAGFVINKGGATATDVLELMKLIQKTVYDNSGIMLEPEVRIIGGSLE